MPTKIQIEKAKKIKSEVKKDLPEEMYRETCRLIRKQEMEIIGLSTESAKERYGAEKCEQTIAAKKKSIKNLKEELQIIVDHL